MLSIHSQRGWAARGGGALEMLAFTNTRAQTRGEGKSRGVWEASDWVPIKDPDPDPVETDSVYTQGLRQGAATFARLEGQHGTGDLCRLDQRRRRRGWPGLGIRSRGGANCSPLRISRARGAGHAGQHMREPRGGLVLCEDGDGEDYVRGLTTTGRNLPVRQEQRDSGRREGTDWKGISATASSRGDLQPGWALAVLQHSETRNLVRLDRTMGARLDLGVSAIPRYMLGPAGNFGVGLHAGYTKLTEYTGCLGETACTGTRPVSVKLGQLQRMRRRHRK